MEKKKEVIWEYFLWDEIEDHIYHFTVMALIFFKRKVIGFIDFENFFQLSYSIK